MGENTLIRCVECGSFVDRDDGRIIDGYFYCYDCFHTCDSCGTVFTGDSFSLTDDENTTLCESCFERYPTCDDCDDTFSTRNCRYYPDIDRTLCGDCLNDNYSPCYSCGDLFHNDDLSYYDETNEYYCGNCYPPERDDNLHDHDYMPKLYFHSVNGCTDKSEPDTLYFGREIEVDGGSGDLGIIPVLVEKYEGKNLFWFGEDGSLTRGFECISHPMTLDFIKSHSYDRDLLSDLKKAGWKSHDTKTCGLHIHVNRLFFGQEQAEYEAKLIYIHERFFDKFLVFSRRNWDSYNNWCKRYQHFDATSSAIDEYDGKIRSNWDRYHAINRTNSNTIEFRIFGGTLKYETYMASIELVDLLCRFVKDHSLFEVYALRWCDICQMSEKYEYLPAYLKDRRLWENVPAEISWEQFVKIANEG
jgi:hypothetical protein